MTESGKVVSRGPLLRSPVGSLDVFRPTLTRPGFQNMLVVFVGWVLTTGTHAVTQALVETGVAGRRHHEAFHRFFSRGTWSPDDLAQQLLQWILRRASPDNKPLRVALDDTLTDDHHSRLVCWVAPKVYAHFYVACWD